MCGGLPTPRIPPQLVPCGRPPTTGIRHTYLAPIGFDLHCSDATQSKSLELFDVVAFFAKPLQGRAFPAGFRDKFVWKPLVVHARRKYSVTQTQLVMQNIEKHVPN